MNQKQRALDIASTDMILLCIESEDHQVPVPFLEIEIHASFVALD